jgi:hypothetical protein
MGAHISNLESVDLKDLPADVYETLVSQTYTVQRSSKNPDDPVPGFKGAPEDPGWIIPREPVQTWKAAHAAFVKDGDTKTWRVHMTNGRELSDPAFVYGWRKIGSFWPTNMTTWEEREVWIEQLRAQVRTLKTPMQKQEEQEPKKPMSEERNA